MSTTNDTRTLEEIVEGLTIDNGAGQKAWLEDAVCRAAATNSLNTSVGAILKIDDVRDNKLVAYIGCNFNNRVHAEVSAILRAQSYGEIISGSTLYSTWASCRDCARAIVDAGIARVVTLDKTLRLTPDRWRDSVRDGLAYLLANGVKVERYTGTLGMELKFDGKVIDV